MTHTQLRIQDVVADMLTTGMGDDGYMVGKATQHSPVQLMFTSKALMLDALGSLASVGRLVTQAYSTIDAIYYVMVYA